MKKMNPVVHFEMPAKDRKRMADFYSKVFGWQTNFMGEEMGNYVVVSTGENDENGRPKIPGTINGGFYEKPGSMQEAHPSIVIAVDDINEAINDIKASGGTMLNEPMDIPGVGTYCSFVDTEGNTASILKPLTGQMDGCEATATAG